MPSITQTRIRNTCLGALAASLAIVLALIGSGLISADVPWPTPPPGPRPPDPRVISSGIKPANVPAVAGATLWLIPPLAVPVPRFPPVPSSEFDSPDGVRIVADAGSITSTVQVVYEPIPVAQAKPAAAGQGLRKVFVLRSYDHQADRVDLGMRRPWTMDVQISGLTESFEDPGRLLIARYDDSLGWTPLVTSYYRDSGILRARLLGMGTFAVISETVAP